MQEGHGAGPERAQQGLGILLQGKCKLHLEKDYCGSLSWEEYKFLYISDFTAEKKPIFGVRTIQV